MRFLSSLFKAVLIFFGYYATHIVCAVLLPLSSVGYTICANLLFLLFVAITALARRRSPLKAVGVRTMRRSHWFAAVGLGVGGSVLVRLMMLTVPFPESWTQSYTERVDAVMQAPAWLLYLSTVVLAPIAEEVVFRGLMYRGLKKGMPRIFAAALSSAMFAVLHGTIMWMLYTFLLALLLVWLYEKTQSLWACMACHTAFNVAGQISLGDGALRIVIIVAGVAIFVISLIVLRDKK